MTSLSEFANRTFILFWRNIEIFLLPSSKFLLLFFYDQISCKNNQKAHPYCIYKSKQTTRT